MNEGIPIEERVVDRLKEIRNQIKENRPNKAINNIDFFISYLEGDRIKKRKRKMIYGEFFGEGKSKGTIKVNDILKKIPLQDWVKDLEFADKQRIRIIVESIGVLRE